MSHYKAKLLLIKSVILVSVLSNILSTHFFEFEGRDIINHNTPLALKPHDPSQNNTGVQSTTSRIYKTNNSLHLMFLHWSIKPTALSPR